MKAMEIKEQNSSSGIDKKISRMERWLKRCAASCGCGAWSSALMDVECLQAEARAFREELWAAVENEKPCRADIPLWKNILSAAKAVSLALFFVMAADFPLSIDQEKPHNAFMLGSGSIALLTSTEGEIINGLREALCKGNRGRVVLTVDIPQEQPAQPAMMTGTASAKERRASPAVADRVQEISAPVSVVKKTDGAAQQAEPAELSAEEVVSLIQIGQRALITSDSAIKIVN